jgi:hypothetical protein
VSYWLCADSDIEDLNVNSWPWGATMALIQQSNILKAGVEIYGDRMVFARMDSCARLADWFEGQVLSNLERGSRIMSDGTITTDPDDGTFHREAIADNYSVDREWLLDFVSFLRQCGGFSTLG